MIRLPKNRPPTRPGAMLTEEFLRPNGITQTQLAAAIHVPLARVNEFVKGKRGVTLDTARRLARFFGTSPELWLNLQLAWDLWQAEHAENAGDIDRIEPFKRAG